MNDYTLENKISVTQEFLNELISRSWQDIENLKNQISSIASVTSQDKALHLLLNNLLTNYYIFAGCLENLETDFDVTTETVFSDDNEKLEIEQTEIQTEIAKPQVQQQTQLLNEPTDDFEPFEYFVDFDEPIGEKLTDKDLYV